MKLRTWFCPFLHTRITNPESCERRKSEATGATTVRQQDAMNKHIAAVEFVDCSTCKGPIELPESEWVDTGEHSQPQTTSQQGDISL